MIVAPRAFLNAVPFTVFLEEFGQRRLTLDGTFHAGRVGTLFDLRIHPRCQLARLFHGHVGESAQRNALRLATFDPAINGKSLDPAGRHSDLEARGFSVVIGDALVARRRRKTR